MILHKYQSPAEKVKKATDIVKLVRVKMLNAHPFYAQIALSLRLKPCGIGTMATDGKNLYFDPEFVCGASEEYIEETMKFYKELHKIGVITQQQLDEYKESQKKWFYPKSEEEMTFIVMHELRHVINEHMARGKTLDKSLFNKAADYNINNRLAWEIYKGIDKAKEKLPIAKHMCINEKYCDYSNGNYSEWISEKIYVDLLENGEGKGSSFDVHLDISDEQKEQIRDLIIAASISAGDKTPSDVRDMVKEWTSSKITWKKLLDRGVKSYNIHDYNYQIPASRSWYVTNTMRGKGYINSSQHIINPSYTKETTIEIAAFFDTSGSIGAETLQKICSEIAAIMRQFQQCKVHMTCWDTKIHNYQCFDQAGLNDLKNYEIKGGGGTDPDCIADFIKEKNIKPINTLIFTDGHFSTDYQKFSNKGLIWVAFDNPEFMAGKGKTVHYKD